MTTTSTTQTEIKLYLGQYIYVLNRYGKHLRKVTWLGNNKFEWGSGWAKVGELKLNTDKKSKVKFILKEE